MLKVLVVVAFVWALLMPPLFTGGDCTREFDAQSAQIQADRKALATLPAAVEYWRNRGVPPKVLSVEQCRRARNKFIEHCGPGPLLLAEVPVKNPICKIYRDSEVTVQLHFDAKDRLSAVQADMAPFRSLPVPGMAKTIDWGR